MRKFLSTMVLIGFASPVFAAEIVQSPVPQQTLAAHGTIDHQAACLSGKQAVGGGYEITNDKNALTATSSHPYVSNGKDATAWRVVITNQTDAPANAVATIYAVCE